ncbi:MAG: DUF1127 domain-containing protein [Geminicoccaceae bacterium]
METQNCTHTISTPSLPSSVRMAPIGVRILKHFLEWSARSQQRRNLAALDDAALKDIGFSRADVQHEVSKPFWQP